jgi:hypothetical protein
VAGGGDPRVPMRAPQARLFTFTGDVYPMGMMAWLRALVAAFCLSCNAGGSTQFIWAYRVCDLKSPKCFDDEALFRNEADCLTYREYNSHRCLHGSALNGAAEGDAACWKDTSTISRGECRKR